APCPKRAPPLPPRRWPPHRWRPRRPPAAPPAPAPSPAHLRAHPPTPVKPQSLASSVLLLLQPRVRIHRIAIPPQFEIQRRRPGAAGTADAGNRVATLDRCAGVAQHRLI